MSNMTFQSFNEFYPYYLSEHSDRRSRALHYIGTLLSVGVAAISVIAGPLWLLALAPVCGYFFAWIGHFFIEKNRPATFTHPLWSFMGDYKMLWQALTGTLDKQHFE